MPTYQYACTSDECGLRFERVQSFTDDAISVCPNCSERVRKVYGSVGVVFKGSGFYRNDSRDAKLSSEPGKKESSDSSKSDSSKSDSGSGSGSEKSSPAAAKKDGGSDASSSSSGGEKSSSAKSSSDSKPSTPVAG